MNNHYYIGLDVGGTKIEGSLAQLDPILKNVQINASMRLSSEYEKTSSGVINAVNFIIKNLLEKSGVPLSEIKALGIGLPGSLHSETRIMINGNTQYLIGIDLINEIKKYWNDAFPIFAQNDANCFVLAEAWAGVGKTFQKEKNISFEQQVGIGITLGTGVGGGLISQGKLYEGAYGSALEVGHFSLYPNGPECYCGNKGCSELYLSGTAINRTMDSRQLFLNLDHNQIEAVNFLKNYQESLINFLVTLNNLFNPHYFVFGGGLSNQKKLFEGIDSKFTQRIFLPETYSPKIYINQLGDSSGVFGAMIYAQTNL